MISAVCEQYFCLIEVKENAPFFVFTRQHLTLKQQSLWWWLFLVMGFYTCLASLHDMVQQARTIDRKRKRRLHKVWFPLPLLSRFKSDLGLVIKVHAGFHSNIYSQDPPQQTAWQAYKPKCLSSDLDAKLFFPWNLGIAPLTFRYCGLSPSK